jgi:hypothetical protein
LRRAYIFMSQNEDQSKPDTPARGLRRLGAPAAVVIAFLLALGAYYLFYAKKNEDYLINRNHRLLATMGGQIGAAVDSERKILRTLHDLQEASRQRRKSGGEDGLRAVLDKAREQYGVSLSDAGPCHDRRDSRVRRYAAAGEEPSFRGLELAPDGYRLNYRYEDLCGWVRLEELLAPILVSRAFDAVLLADEHGDVIVRPAGLSIHSLGLLFDPAGSLPGQGGERGKGGDKAEGGGKPESASFQAVLHTLMGASRERELDVDVAGRKFKLFVQPVRLPVLESVAEKPSRQKKDPAAADGRHGDWLLCGLVPSAKISSDSLAVPPSYLAAAVGALLLCLLCWPLLKLKLMGERQRVRMADLLMVALCSVLGVCVVTLFLLDFDHHRELESLADSQLAGFASGMAHNLEEEIQRAYEQIEVLENVAAARGVPELHGLLREKGIEDRLACYPFLETFMLIDGAGQARLKWSADNVTVPLRRSPPLRTKGYFQRTLRGDTWSLPPWKARCAAAAGIHQESKASPFVLESHVSAISGVRQAVLAKPVPRHPGSAAAELEDWRVATLSMPMLSVIGPVVPPDVEFAVIDQEGKVQFHSDAMRNLAEDLFAETDQDKHLRSAVFARHRATLDVRYWGDDYKASLAPVRGTLWTIVALRIKAPVEAANLQTVLTSAVFIIAYVGAFALVLAAAALFRTAFRADWLWPAPERSNDYLRLALLYSLLIVTFVPALFLLPQDGRLVALACLLSLLAILLGYLQLTRHRRQGASNLAWTSPIVLLMLLLAWLLAPADSRPSLALALPAVLAAAFLVSVRPQWWRRLTRRRQVSISWAYPVLGAQLLLLTAALPTLCIFMLAQRIQTDCLIKHGQLELAMAVTERHNRAARIYSEQWGAGKGNLMQPQLVEGTQRYRTLPLAVDFKRLPAGVLEMNQELVNQNLAVWASRSLNFYGKFFFHTQIAGPDPNEGKEGASLGKAPSSDSQPPAGVAKLRNLPDFLEALLPIYSPYSAETRELLHDLADDNSWHWDRDGEALALESEDLGFRVYSWPHRTWLSAAAPISEPPDDAPLPARQDRPPGRPAQVPAVAAAAVREPAARWPAVWAAWAAAVWAAWAPAVWAAGTGSAAVALFLLLLLGVAYFISRHVFLVDLFEPLWSGREGELPATVGGNILLVSRRQEWRIHNAEQSFTRLRLMDLADDLAGWPARRLEVLHSLPARTVLVEGFDHRIFDPAFNDMKLALLEGLAAERTVVVLSTVSPAALFAGQDAAAMAPITTLATMAISPGSVERWRSLLASFTLIDQDARPQVDETSLSDLTVLAWRDLKKLLRNGHRDGAAAAAAGHGFRSALLGQECGGNAFLLQIGRELDPLASGLAARQLLEEFGERAEVYYRSLWASCSRDEMVVLGHLAEEGLVNEKDRRVVRRLMARGLVRRESGFRVMNETFRRFLVSPACRAEVLEHEQVTGESPWDRFRRPFFAVLAAGAVFFLSTQKQLLDGSMAVVTAATAGLPAILKVLDLLSGRKAGAGAK